jgi:outer membrane lipoprotein
MNKQTTKQEAYEKIPFPEIAKSPDSYKGKVVRLGGVIIKTENREEDTVFEILEKPLNWRGRPKPGDYSGGRFMVVFEKFLDEAIYHPNRPITVVGEVVGTKRASIGEKTYDYPLLSGREIRLWEEGGYMGGPRMHIGIGIGGGSGGSHGTVGIGTTF